MIGLRALLVLVALGGVASAQPGRTCQVVVALAPDDVRAEIEAWVRSEPRCLRELEVRVVPTEDGLYLSAIDARGHVRERLVPDAQSAAVLVVSWMADDSLGPRLPARALLDPGLPRIAPSSVDDSEIPGEVMPPGLMRSIQRRDLARGRRWLTLGAVGTDRAEVGVRAQADILAGRTWSLGLAGGWRDDRDADVGQIRAVVGATYSSGRISLRGQLGIGANITTRGDRMDRDDEMSTRGLEITPAIEAAVLAKLQITQTWGLVGGPIVETSTAQRTALSVFLGVQRTL